MSNAIVLCALAALATGCASAAGARYAASAPPLRDDQVASTVTADVKAPVSVVFDYVVREDTPARDLKSFGPIAGVSGDRRLTPGGWDHAGAKRIVLLDDGTTLHEEIELLDRPGHFRYRVADFSSSFGAFVAEGHGYWDLSPTEEGTHVTWTYVLTARSCEARPFVEAAVGAFFQPYMQRGLSSIREHAEHSRASPNGALVPLRRCSHPMRTGEAGPGRVARGICRGAIGAANRLDITTDAYHATAGPRSRRVSFRASS